MKTTPVMRERLKKAGITIAAFHTRIQRGWSLDAALNTPLETQNHSKEYYIKKNCKFICKKNGTSAVAKYITQKSSKYDFSTNIITKNMVIGQIYRKGYAVFFINGDKYSVSLTNETKDK